MKIKVSEKGENDFEQINNVIGALEEFFLLNNYSVRDGIAAMLTISVHYLRKSGLDSKEFKYYMNELWKNDEEHL